MSLLRSTVLATMFVSTAALVGCSGDDESEAKAAREPTRQSSAALESGSDASESVTNAIKLLDGQFGIDKLGFGMATKVTTSCVKVDASLEGVVVDFGSGCELSEGKSASGALRIKWAGFASGQKGVEVAFEKIVFGAVDLDGSITVSRSDGAVNITIASLTSLGATLDGSVDVTGSREGRVYDGSVTHTGKEGKTSVALDKIAVKRAGCFPHAGSLSIDSPKTKVLVTFDEASGTSGEVKVTTPEGEKRIELEAKGHCAAPKQDESGEKSESGSP